MHIAHDKTTDGSVVVKIFKTEFFRESRKEIEAEMYALEHLNHPRIIKMLEQGFEGVLLSFSGVKINMAYIVMEHIKSLDLVDLINYHNSIDDWRGEEIGKIFLP